MASPEIFELKPKSTSDEVNVIIRAVYRQVLGNPHVMESERLTSSESRLKRRGITVREFVREVALSDFYRTRYFEACDPCRFVELNFIHILGRAPEDQREVSEHIVRCVAEGYDAEISSYVNSDEYSAAFGENTVPYYRGKLSEANPRQVGFNVLFSLDRGPAQVDSSVKVSQVANSNRTTVAIKPSKATVVGSGSEKRFKICVAGSKFDSPRRRSSTEYIVPASKMTPQIQRINRTSGKIISITEIE